MGLFGFILLVVIILAILGLGWETFSSGVISGFDKDSRRWYACHQELDTRSQRLRR